MTSCATAARASDRRTAPPNLASLQLTELIRVAEKYGLDPMPNEMPWEPEPDPADVVRMAEDAAHAVLAFGIADDTWVRESFGAMEDVAPFAALRTALILGESPVASTLSSAP